MTYINGIHHISMKTVDEKQYLEVLHFYHDLLGLTIKNEMENGILLDTGKGVLEIFKGGIQKEEGVIEHFAFDTHHVDEMVEIVRNAGYPILVEPKDVVISGTNTIIARIAFCIGPAGEKIEFFDEK